MITRRVDRKPTMGERGAFSVMYALMITMLLAVAALGMDLGNAFSRKTDTQNQADFAAYDVGQEYALELASGGTNPPHPDIVKDVAESLNNNQPQDDDSACWRAKNCITEAQLTDTLLANGEVRYTAQGLQVVAPFARINFGFATVFGTSGTSVQSAATVNVFSAAPGIFPLFAMDSACAAGNYFHEGYTVVKETTGGGTPPPDNPVLLHPTDDNNTELSGIKVFDPTGVLVFDSAGTTQGGILVGDHGYSLQVAGKKWNSIEVGFFREAQGAETAPIKVVRPIGFTATSTGNTVTTFPFAVPNEVADTEAWWYLRVRNAGTDVEWSPVNAGPEDKAQRFKVGNPQVLPGCAADASNQGNFGMISMPQQENYNDESELAWNIAAGIDDPMGLTVHPHPLVDAGNCQEFPSIYPDSSNEAGTSNGNPQPEAGVNCLSTITGLFKGIETGLIQGPSAGQPGLLNASVNPTRSGCGSNFPVNMQDGGVFNLNGESIQCYFDSTTDTWATAAPLVAKTSYSGPPVFDPEIFRSPRFGIVPVFTGTVTGTGAKKAILTFQAAFITDNPFYSNDDATPGLYFTANGSGRLTLKSVTMFLFSLNALPAPPDDVELIDYLGVGNPIVHLVD